MGTKTRLHFKKCEREFVKGNGRNVKMFYSDSYEVEKIVKYMRRTRFKLTRKLFVGN